MHSDSGGAGRFRNLHLTSSHGWPLLDLPSWISLQDPHAEQLSSQGCRTTWVGNVEGPTPTVCQSRNCSDLVWRVNGPAKKAIVPVRAGLKLIPPGPLVLSCPAQCSGGLFSAYGSLYGPEHSYLHACMYPFSIHPRSFTPHVLSRTSYDRGRLQQGAKHFQAGRERA